MSTSFPYFAKYSFNNPFVSLSIHTNNKRHRERERYIRETHYLREMKEVWFLTWNCSYRPVSKMVPSKSNITAKIFVFGLQDSQQLIFKLKKCVCVYVCVCVCVWERERERERERGTKCVWEVKWGSYIYKALIRIYALKEAKGGINTHKEEWKACLKPLCWPLGPL